MFLNVTVLILILINTFFSINNKTITNLFSILKTNKRIASQLFKDFKKL